MRTYPALALLWCLLPGCGTKGDGDLTAGSSGDTTGEATGATGTDSDSSGSTSTAGTDSGGGTGDACAEFRDDDPIGPEVTIVVTNTSDQPVFIPEAKDCAIQPLFEVAGHTWFAGGCGITCDDAMAGQCACPTACPADSVLRIEPGGSIEAKWPGHLLESTTLTDACTHDVCGSSCSVVKQAPAATYDLAIFAYPEMSCQGTACDCGVEDSCLLQGTVQGTAAGHGATVAYPDTTAVQIDL